MATLWELLARSYSRYIFNGKRRSDNPITEEDIQRVPGDAVFQQLRLALPDYMKSISRNAIHRACYESLSKTEVCPGDNQTIYELFIESFVEVVTRDANEAFSLSFCRGCEYVDSCGFKGHPSQTKHECLMTSRFVRLTRSHGEFE